MLTENFLVKEITFPKGEFIKACEQVSSDFGIKGQDWFNVTCMRKGDKEVMTFRHKGPVIIGYWDALEMVGDGYAEFLQLMEDEGTTQIIDGKKCYLLSDIEMFNKIYNG